MLTDFGIVSIDFYSRVLERGLWFTIVLLRCMCYASMYFYCPSKKSWPILYSKLLCKLGQNFLDIQYWTAVCNICDGKNALSFSNLLLFKQKKRLFLLTKWQKWERKECLHDFLWGVSEVLQSRYRLKSYNFRIKLL